MRRLSIFFAICFVAAIVAVAYQRNPGVQAGSVAGTATKTAPLAAKTTAPEHDGANTEIAGELTRVDLGKKAFTTRVNNGMEQTFKFDDRTAVRGLPIVDAPKVSSGEAKPPINPMSALVGKEGSELSVQWTEDAGGKKATNVSVTEISISRKNVRR